MTGISSAIMGWWWAYFEIEGHSFESPSCSLSEIALLANWTSGAMCCWEWVWPSLYSSRATESMVEQSVQLVQCLGFLRHAWRLITAQFSRETCLPLECSEAIPIAEVSTVPPPSLACSSELLNCWDCSLHLQPGARAHLCGFPLFDLFQGNQLAHWERMGQQVILLSSHWNNWIKCWTGAEHANHETLSKITSYNFWFLC